MGCDPIGRVAELRAIERAAASEPLMERAGHAAAGAARDLLAGRGPRVLILAGPGDNGGDALVVARWLKRWFFDVTVAFHGDAGKLSAAAAAAHQAWRDVGGTVRPDWPASGDWNLIVDGLFGIGLKRPVEGEAAQWIGRVNASAARILALDIPSGLNADTGVAYRPTIRAHATATFIALKPGLLTADGPDHCGAIGVHALGLDTAAGAPGRRLDWPSLTGQLPEPLRRARRNVHKGSFGTLGIVGGSDGMVGAAILAGGAALHLGAGKIWVGLATAPPAVDWLQPELMLKNAHAVLEAGPDALVVGPGLGTDERARDLLARALALPLPLLLDADALNLLAGDAQLAQSVAARAAPTAVTPHPAEAARLLATTTAAVQDDRLAAALALATKLRAAVVLKGAGSILAFATGAWAINSSGNPGLASGGTGDVLSGMAGAFLAQGIAMDDALKCAVCLHGAAADALVAAGIGPLGLTASELAPAARRLLNAAALANPAAPTE
ncbi:MAG TPA: NAD(P)H-hydrate dehydratase [Casimicrobiaceae bacterium]|nr:NAD(P)H-hydrate dehydratase [Casimicrobiaceae bacterium]